MKVLVAIPTKRGMLFRRACDSVLRLKWDSQLDIMYLLGGDTDPLYWNNLLKKLNDARTAMLNGGYDALLTIDSDIIVPPDALKKLAAVDADVIYGLIALRLRGSNEHPWSVSTSLDQQSMTFLSHDAEAARAAWGKVIDCVGHGQAISLVHRRVFEKIEFRTLQPIIHAPDWDFSIDCQREGFTQKHHLGVVCGHIDTDPLRIYWPDPEPEALYKVTLLGEIPTRRHWTRDDGMEPFYSQFVKPGDLVFNIGAYVGIRTPAFLNLGAGVVAIEPHPRSCEILRSNFGDKAIIIEALVGAKEGYGDLWLCDDLSTCSLEWMESQAESGSLQAAKTKIMLPMTTLDGLIKQYGTPDFCKIDVEGYEIEVLKGLSQPLKALCFEFHVTYLKSAMECLDRLVSLGMDRFNYIVQDTMKFSLPEWIGAEEMKEVLVSLPAETLFGDIFAIRGGQ